MFRYFTRTVAVRTPAMASTQPPWSSCSLLMSARSSFTSTKSPASIFSSLVFTCCRISGLRVQLKTRWRPGFASQRANTAHSLVAVDDFDVHVTVPIHAVHNRLQSQRLQHATQCSCTFRSDTCHSLASCAGSIRRASPGRSSRRPPLRECAPRRTCS